MRIEGRSGRAPARRGTAARIVGLLALGWVGPAVAQTPGRLMTLAQLLDASASRSPALRVAAARLAQAEAAQVTARTYPHDPQLTFGAAHREGGGGEATDAEVELSQVIEIGGQGGRREAEASAGVAAARAGFLREERRLAAAVAAAFVEAQRARDVVGIEEANVELARGLSEVARRRQEAGSAPQFESNVAEIQLSRAERSLSLARAAYDIARAVLAESAGLDPAEPPIPDGELDLEPRPSETLAELLDGAVRHRGDLAAFRAEVEASRARIDLARRGAVPDLVVSGSYGREEETDRLVGGAIGIRIPLFNRNQGPIAEAGAAEIGARADLEAATLQARREVLVARARHAAAADAASTAREQMLAPFEENLALLLLAFEAGKTGWADVLVLRRELHDARREYVDTLAAARLAGIELDLALGRMPWSPGP